MRPRHADTLRAMGYGGEVAEFRRVLAEAKADPYPGVTDEELIFTRDAAAGYCGEVRRRLGAPRLTRVFILRSLVGLRKHRKVRRKEAAGA